MNQSVVNMGYSRYTLVEVGMQRIACPSASAFCYSVPSCRDEGDYPGTTVRSVLMRVLKRGYPVFSPAMMAHIIVLNQSRFSSIKDKLIDTECHLELMSMQI